MHKFEVEAVWRHDRECRLRVRGKPELTVATPPEFGGPEGIWSPEELLVGSVGSCLLSTFLYFAYRFQLSFECCSSRSTGTLEKTAKGLRFSGVDVHIMVTVTDDEALEKAAALRMKEKLEKYCLVSASLGCPVQLALELTTPAEQQGLNAET